MRNFRHWNSIIIWLNSTVHDRVTVGLEPHSASEASTGAFAHRKSNFSPLPNRLLTLSSLYLSHEARLIFVRKITPFRHTTLRSPQIHILSALVPFLIPIPAPRVSIIVSYSQSILPDTLVVVGRGRMGCLVFWVLWRYIR